MGLMNNLPKVPLQIITLVLVYTPVTRTALSSDRMMPTRFLCHVAIKHNYH